MKMLHGDCLDLLPSVPDGSVDMVFADLLRYIVPMKHDLKAMYRRGMTIQNIADKVGYSYVKTRNRLLAEGVTLRNKGEILGGRKFSVVTRQRMSTSRQHYFASGGKTWNDGKKLDGSQLRAQIRNRITYKLYVESYPDIAKLRFLTWYVSRHRTHLDAAGVAPHEFIDRFYADRAFCVLYAAWIRSGKCKWSRPSLDHVDPKCGGGSWLLGNLRFITWFENRAKADMPLAEWIAFRKRTGTDSKLFIENIMEGC